MTYVYSGLYDPVLDNYEPIYESIERADSDLRSEPTEVLDPQDLSLDDPNILDPITDPSLWDSGYATTPLTESRSLNASPFVPNTKPYRPFSTEPLQDLPLDDPLILNPNFKDTFNLNGNIQELNLEEDDLIRILPLDKNVEAKFKLPVSEKYDPEWEKKVRSMLAKCAEGGKRETQQVESELVYYSEKPKAATEINAEVIDSIKKTVVDSSTVMRKSDLMTKLDIKFNETRVEESVKRSVEQTALEVVDESIERAVSVAEDIKKEIEEELRTSMTTELQIEECKTKTEMMCFNKEVKEKEYRKESFSKCNMPESVQHETSKKLMQETAIRIIENEDSEKVHQQEENVMKEIKLLSKQAIEDTIEPGNVKKKLPAYEKKDRSLTETDNNNQIMEESETIKKYSMAFEREDMPATVQRRKSREVLQTDEIKSEHRKGLKSSDIFSQDTSNSDGKQKAYMIGLQTIPHIKGFVQSSYHFDLLLRTFFVHLTDVMVALSRFLLTQPSQELESKAKKVVEDKLIKEFTMKDTRRFEEKRGMERRHEEIKENMNTEHETMRQEQDTRQETNNVQSKQTITLDKSEMQQQQNKYKQEIKQDEQKLKVMKSQEVSENRENFDIYLEDVEIKKKSGAQMAQRTQRKSKDLTKKMDAVINEFEIKTGIEERLEVTEQRSRRSRSRSQIEEEVMRDSDPLEWLDKVDSRRASQGRSDVTSTETELHTYTGSKESKRAETKIESRTTKVEPGKQMYVAIVESHVYTNKDAILEDQIAEMSETVSTQSSEDITTALDEAISTRKEAMSNVIQSEEKQQAVEILINALQEVVQEKQEVLESVTDSKLQRAKEYYDVTLEAVEKNIDIKKSEYNAVSKKEVLTLVAAEATEIIDEAKLESFETKEAKTKIAVESSEEKYKEAAQSAIEIVLETSKEESTELKGKQKAVSKVESLAIAVAESTDVVVDDSKVDIFENKEVVSQRATVSSEETFKNAAVSIAEVMFETAEEKHSDHSKTKEVSIKQEGQHLAVAGIIETRTELCTEPKKPAQDEFASLKIIKEQIINGEESTEILTESELNVQQSIEVEMSSQNTKSSVSEASFQSISQELTSVQESSSSVQESSRLAQESSMFMQQTSTSSSNLHTSLHINTNLALQQRSDEIDENNNTPTPTTVPPTPLTDEYVFKLEIPLPKNQGTVVIEESPDREDPHIVKKGLVPYIETTIGEQVIYDPPLPTPPEDKVQSPVYTKPGLRGGAQPLLRKVSEIVVKIMYQF